LSWLNGKLSWRQLTWGNQLFDAVDEIFTSPSVDIIEDLFRNWIRQPEQVIHSNGSYATERLSDVSYIVLGWPEDCEPWYLSNSLYDLTFDIKTLWDCFRSRNSECFWEWNLDFISGQECRWSTLNLAFPPDSKSSYQGHFSLRHPYLSFIFYSVIVVGPSVLDHPLKPLHPIGRHRHEHFSVDLTQ
jgi:hypothetical protein